MKSQQKGSAKSQLGQRGEQLALEHLKQKGCAIVQTNWRCKHGEVDIVARDGETLVFVEVRTRRSATTETAFESVNPRKQKRLQALAYAYVSEFRSQSAWRVDVIAVAVPYNGQPIIEHVENALEW